MLNMHIVNEYINSCWRQNVFIDFNDVMFKQALYTQVQTLMSLLLIKMSPSNIQKILIKASSFLLFKYFNFYFFTLKAPFIRSWPININLSSWHHHDFFLNRLMMSVISQILERRICE